MNFRSISLASLGVMLLAGIAFFYLSFSLPVKERSLVIGAGYYPRVLSLLLIVSSAAGLFTSFRDKESKKVSIDIIQPKYFFFTLGLAFLLAGVWHLTGKFYPICIVVVILMLWFLNPEAPSIRKAFKTMLTAAMLMGFIFVVFNMLLQFNL